MRFSRYLGLLSILLFARQASATPYRIDPDRSILSIVTHKKGFASGLSHDHFITATVYSVQMDATSVDGGTFKITVPVRHLEADSPEKKGLWINRLKELDVMTEDFASMDGDDRAKVAEHMRSEDQLDMAKFPDITAELVELARVPAKLGSVNFSHQAALKLTVHGQTVTKMVTANVTSEGDLIKIEAVAPLKFTDFAIEPVSMLLGAIQVDDVMYLYVNITAKKIA